MAPFSVRPTRWYTLVTTLAIASVTLVAGAISDASARMPGGGGYAASYNAPYPSGGTYQTVDITPSSGWCGNVASTSGNVFPNNGTAVRSATLNQLSGSCNAWIMSFDDIDSPVFTAPASGSYTFQFNWYVNWNIGMSVDCTGGGYAIANASMWVLGAVVTTGMSVVGSGSLHFASLNPSGVPCWTYSPSSGSAFEVLYVTTSLVAETQYLTWSGIGGFSHAAGADLGYASISYSAFTESKTPTYLSGVVVTCSC